MSGPIGIVKAANNVKREQHKTVYLAQPDYVNIMSGPVRLDGHGLLYFIIPIGRT